MTSRDWLLVADPWFWHPPPDPRNSYLRMSEIDRLSPPSPSRPAPFRPLRHQPRLECDWCFEPYTVGASWNGGRGHPACAMRAHYAVMGHDVPWLPQVGAK